MVETFQSLPFFYKERKNGIIHMRNNIRIYEVKSEYIKYLNNYQKHIFTQAQEKDKRKYIGIVFEVKGIKYFAPLSSFKDKHKQMKEGVDFIKIKDYAVINLNNMIPVPDSQIVDIDINKEKNASYRYLLQAESREVNKQKNRIRKNAEIVYSHKKHNGVSTPLAKRTNNFELLDQLHILIIGHCLAAHTFQMICVELTINHHKSLLLKKFCQKNKCYLGTILNVCEHALSEKTFIQTYAVKSTGKLAVYIGLKA